MATQGIKSKRSSYDASFKLKVIEYAEIHGYRAASREFTVPEINVSFCLHTLMHYILVIIFYEIDFIP